MFQIRRGVRSKCLDKVYDELAKQDDQQIPSSRNARNNSDAQGHRQIVDYIQRRLQGPKRFAYIFDVEEGRVAVSNKVDSTVYAPAYPGIHVLFASNIRIQKGQCIQGNGLISNCPTENQSDREYRALRSMISRYISPYMGVSESHIPINYIIHSCMFVMSLIKERERNQDSMEGLISRLEQFMSVDIKGPESCGDHTTDNEEKQENVNATVEAFKHESLFGRNVNEDSVGIKVEKGEKLRFLPVLKENPSFVLFWIPPLTGEKSKRRSKPTSEKKNKRQCTNETMMNTGDVEYNSNNQKSDVVSSGTAEEAVEAAAEAAAGEGAGESREPSTGSKNTANYTDTNQYGNGLFCSLSEPEPRNPSDLCSPYENEILSCDNTILNDDDLFNEYLYGKRSDNNEDKMVDEERKKKEGKQKEQEEQVDVQGSLNAFPRLFPSWNGDYEGNITDDDDLLKCDPLPFQGSHISPDDMTLPGH